MSHAKRNIPKRPTLRRSLRHHCSYRGSSGDVWSHLTAIFHVHTVHHFCVFFSFRYLIMLTLSPVQWLLAILFSSPVVSENISLLTMLFYQLNMSYELPKFKIYNAFAQSSIIEPELQQFFIRV